MGFGLLDVGLGYTKSLARLVGSLQALAVFKLGESDLRNWVLGYG